MSSTGWVKYVAELVAYQGAARPFQRYTMGIVRGIDPLAAASAADIRWGPATDRQWWECTPVDKASQYQLEAANAREEEEARNHGA